nr:hypothetical protein [Tanacetum cinerariifolium]
MALPPRDQRHRMLMEHRDAQGNVMFTSRDCRRLFNIRGPLVHELILEFFSTFKFGKGSMLRLCHRLIACSIAERSQAHKKVILIDLSYLRGMYVDSVNIPYLLKIDDTWALVAQGPERQHVVTTGALEVAEDVPIVDEAAQAIRAPIQAPQPPSAARSMPRRMAMIEEDVCKIRGALGEQREVVDVMVKDFS